VSLKATIAADKATLDHEAPKLALIEQLRKLDPIGGLSILVALGQSDEDLQQRLERDGKAALAWEFATRRIIRQLIPHYESDFNEGPSLPLLGFPNVTIKPPTVAELQEWKAAKFDALSQIIKEL
jgi:hypothetical protein